MKDGPQFRGFNNFVAQDILPLTKMRTAMRGHNNNKGFTYGLR